MVLMPPFLYFSLLHKSDIVLGSNTCYELSPTCITLPATSFPNTDDDLMMDYLLPNHVAIKYMPGCV